jgi:alkanesulfonate monooxygenase SsuD/methylene tetrahydromethanopterin reductase-like flavin-dependent oxidoreductase (luciferase family)
MTKRGPSIVNPYTRHPVNVIRAIAHLDVPDLIDKIPLETQLRFGIAGTPGECVAQLKLSLDPRIDVMHVIPHPPHPWQQNWPVAFQLLAEQVFPHLR